jgi:hypothetical protein
VNLRPAEGCNLRRSRQNSRACWYRR